MRGWYNGRVWAACVCLAVLALAGCAAPGEQSCKLALATKLSFRAQRQQIFVDVLINGQPTNFIFDTGNEQTTLTTAAAIRLGLTPKGLRGAYAAGIGGRKSLSRTRVTDMQIGTMKGTGFKVMVADISVARTDPPTDGILGMDFLVGYDIDLDWAGKEAVFYSRIEGCTTPSAALGQPLYTIALLPQRGPHPAIRFPVTIAGQTFLAELDTGAATTTVFRRAASKLGLTALVLAKDRHAYLGGVGGHPVAAARHVFDAVTIGDLTLNNTPIYVADQNLGDIDLLIGLPFTKAVHVWISNSSNTLILQYPPSASPRI